FNKNTLGVAKPNPAWHAHHILFKVGNGPCQQALVKEGQGILMKYGIDPIFGKENFVWAPNKAGVHTIDTLEALLRDLRMADVSGSKQAVVDALTKHGKIAAGK